MMLAKTPLIDLAIAWAAQQPPERTYVWKVRCICACAQLASALDREQEWCDMPKLPPGSSEWYQLDKIAKEWPHTFGAFHERLMQCQNM